MTAAQRATAAAIRGMPPGEREALARRFRPRLTKYIPHQPTPKQAIFLCLDSAEAFYGGAAGGGKSDALLMGALQYVDVPGYRAMLFRRTYADLSLPEALMDRAAEWLGGTDARWRGTEKTWVFPSGATLTFGYLDNRDDKYRYQGAAGHYIGFDELPHFLEEDYRYLFSRVRRQQGVTIPLRVRAAGNPGGRGHEWVKQRFIVEGKAKGRPFIPATMWDNPHLDHRAYLASLAHLSLVEQQRLRDGNWDAMPEGRTFKREHLLIVPGSPAVAQRVRYWDKAASVHGDYTVGVLMALDPLRQVFVEDVVRGRWEATQRDAIMRQTAERDWQQHGGRVVTWIEQEGGSGGKESAQSSIRLLAGFTVYTETARGDKVTRADPFASYCGAGNVRLVQGTWNGAYIDELAAFPQEGVHDDQVDASSGAFNKLSMGRAVASSHQG